MGRIILVPIEPLEERYSNQWLRWFKQEFDKQGLDYIVIAGEPLTDKIETGAFLDVIGTNYYKATQLQKLCKAIYTKEIKDGDTILMLDGWFPGLEMLAYIRDGMNLKIKICSCLHAGTYDPNDFLAKKCMWSWGKKLEESWFEIADKIFVATEYHRHLIQQMRKVDHRKIEVTGFPIMEEEINYNRKFNQHVVKENIIVFPHRLDEEKRPDLFERLKIELKTHPIFKDWEFLKTKDHCTSKIQYYLLLARSKIAISFAEQETWGIAIQEAVFNDCFPIVPDRLSYTEMYNDRFRYENWSDLIDTLEECVKDEVRAKDFLDMKRRELSCKGKQAIPNMIDIMKML